MTTHHEAKNIPLTKLKLWDGNVRRTGADTAIDELAASIETHELLNPLTVSHGGKGYFVVIAGGRRLAALKKLAKAGKLSKAEPISCMLADHEADASELSLAENVVRVAMHPADQFEAWRGLADQGQEAGQIAARFGVAEGTVRKRLALARVSPVLFDVYRQGQMDLETLQAFTVTDDHDRQEAVWTGLDSWQRDDARAIRRALTESDVPTGDRRVRFVGLEAYEAAGGTIKRDLFAADGGGYCEDAALLERLAVEKLTAIAEEAKAEGWSWTEVRLSYPWDERQQFDEAEPEYGDDDEQEPHWSDEVKALTGCIVFLGHDGAVIERGLIRRGEEQNDEAEDGQKDDAEPEEAKAPALPASLIEDLTAHRTAALRIELARRPDVALAVTVHAMALSVFYQTGERGVKGSLSVRSLKRSIQGHDTCPAVLALQAEAERIRDHLPGNPADLWDWCLSASQDELTDLLAVSVAHGVDAVVTKTDPNRSGVAFGDALAKAVNLDMAAWYAPTAEGYFSRIPKALILSDLEKAKGVPAAPSWEKMKKADLAALAEREVTATGWRPEPLQ